MSAKALHLLHLAALALLLYFFALSARYFGATVAFAIFLPLGILVEVRFWWMLFTSDRNRRSRSDEPV
jgi:multidrug transporter EmrE-like cation transporter